MLRQIDSLKHQGMFFLTKSSGREGSRCSYAGYSFRQWCQEVFKPAFLN
jgi:hypothetical protein